MRPSKRKIKKRESGISIEKPAGVRIKGAGRRRTISISKIRKITASKKNRREKGIRADLFGSNPHSKGEFFSRSNSIFFETEVETTESKRIRSDEKKAAEVKRIIINLYKDFRSYL